MRLFALLWAIPLVAQNALYVDLSGEWRVTVDDQPAFASPEFDDRDWQRMEMPRGEYQFYSPRPRWYRRQVELPAGASREPLALTLGTIQGVYEVYVNGRRIGATGGVDSLDHAQVPQPQTFAVPVEAVPSDGRMRIAIHVIWPLTVPPGWRVPDEGPYLLTYLRHAPLDAGSRALERFRDQSSPALAFGVIFAGMALLSLLAWWSERHRWELLWFMIASLLNGVEAFLARWHLSVTAHPFNRQGALPHILLNALFAPLFGELVLSALGYRQRWLRVSLWVAWVALVAAYLSGAPLSTLMALFYGSSLWGASVAVLVVAWDWRPFRARRRTWEEHAIRIAMVLPALQSADFWLSSFTRRVGVFPRVFVVRGVRVMPDHLFWLCISAAIFVLLIRRLAAARREHQRLASELEAARLIQQLLLRNPQLAEPDLTVEAIYRPALEVGGDFYFVLDGKVVVIGDVSGKGLKAAMLVTLLIGVLRETAQRRPAAILAAMNRAVAGQMEGGFVTCCCARFDGQGAVAIANGGHLSPYLDGSETALPAGLPLGLDRDAEYEEAALRLEPGSALVFLSDGVVEAENEQGELLGFERTREMSGRPAKEIADAAQAWGQNDDITVVTVRRTV